MMKSVFQIWGKNISSFTNGSSTILLSHGGRKIYIHLKSHTKKSSKIKIIKFKIIKCINSITI